MGQTKDQSLNCKLPNRPCSLSLSMCTWSPSEPGRAHSELKTSLGNSEMELENGICPIPGCQNPKSQNRGDSRGPRDPDFKNIASQFVRSATVARGPPSIPRGEDTVGGTFERSPVRTCQEALSSPKVRTYPVGTFAPPRCRHVHGPLLSPRGENARGALLSPR